MAAATDGIRNLGDAEGGHEDNLRFVHHHLTYVAKLLRQARFSSAAVANRLLAEWGQLCQEAGWLAHDAGRAVRDAVELANAAYETARATPIAMRARR
ncbi:MAG: hypothetical protein ACRDRL_24630 [Sciscionella sp.]